MFFNVVVIVVLVDLVVLNHLCKVVVDYVELACLNVLLLLLIFSTSLFHSSLSRLPSKTLLSAIFLCECLLEELDVDDVGFDALLPINLLDVEHDVVNEL